ncbi:LOW QUALITY PROTEIN: hypothetical protein PHPALM_28272 [Phytophthora palmivora]|uniref:Reverse transcriptase RNase H-like domain-containing protein n=1 Tax=Phytophthora palmivora TaxID=4796 RepID=A0A2P4XAJ3_9STRA|nr:LOW QUALITY PROTEIN: hypothetical protein PHPALM_28272 [Phytophthora palmivora]
MFDQLVHCKNHGASVSVNKACDIRITSHIYCECAVYDPVKQALAVSATFAFPKPEAEMTLLTDASDVGRSVIVMQVASWEHKLLICLADSFTGAQNNWSIIEKEAYPIVMACDKLSYLLLRPGGFRMYCDHRNLIHVFAPGHGVKKYTRGNY